MGDIYNECEINYISEKNFKKGLKEIFHIRKKQNVQRQEIIDKANRIIYKFNQDSAELFLNSITRISQETHDTIDILVESSGLIDVLVAPRTQDVFIDIQKDAERIFKESAYGFKQLINLMTNNSSLSLKKIDETLFTWEKNFELYKKNIEVKYKASLESRIQSLEKNFDNIYQSRCQQYCIKLIGKCSMWIQKIGKNPKTNEEKAAKLIKTLNAIKNIAKTRKGVFTKEMIEVLKGCFKNSRNWVAGIATTKAISKKYDYFNNLETTKYMLAIMCTVIDEGCHPIKMILEYVSAS